ncbi:AI-2E family transporter [Roseomonas terrae]|jgi:predicted PurR-regulated permease PerM|uniref:AI-2E family transporter n=1 Tax=Neoroseomonas terrae TaxID=424799 RepID=A0ABS5ENN0_9PROT|nr:AI-2E family transporter [Neoroseomonas terrae]MBR0652637.1 AI-2E family transporter [Neoroseomonas terrae]
MRRASEPPAGPSAAGPDPLWLIAALMVLTALHLGRDVFIPMALALLLSVVLIPPARMLQRMGLPRALTVALLLLLSLSAIGATMLLVISQALSLAADLPNWESNLRAKLRAVSEGSGVLDRAAGTLRRLSEELSGGQAAFTTTAPAAPVDSSGSTLATLLDMASFVAAPAASLAVALLLMAYLLMQREDVRDRFLRLAGLKDIHRTTRAMADATERVGRFLLMQMMLNGIFGLGMGIGLMLIGVPNAPLWGVLAFVLRFIPFLGAWIAVSLPLIVAFATGEGWTGPLLVIALFAVVDGGVTHVLEPLIYGRTVGISPLALLISSAVWTVLWGPIGLLLAPPITACLAILGRHVPAFGFLEILLGDGEALPAPLRFYQRYLADDSEGAQQIAEEHAEAEGVAATLRDLVVPAIHALVADRAAGTLPVSVARRIAADITALATTLTADEAVSPEAHAIRAVPVAGPADRALAAAVAAAARLRGWREAEAGESCAVAILCMSQPVSAPRLRRARAEASRDARGTAGIAIDDLAATQLAPTVAPAPVARSLEALVARLGQAPVGQLKAAKATDGELPLDLGAPAPA